jgi:hypothetical protein
MTGDDQDDAQTGDQHDRSTAREAAADGAAGTRQLLARLAEVAVRYADLRIAEEPGCTTPMARDRNTKREFVSDELSLLLRDGYQVLPVGPHPPPRQRHPPWEAFRHGEVDVSRSG